MYREQQIVQEKGIKNLHLTKHSRQLRSGGYLSETVSNDIYRLGTGKVKTLNDS